ncbi:MAG: hypothetical protein OXI35_16705, partial [Gemmatimonadota bacterium]|nr:hypothetical protein [Gemmatimonadota bacterium]
ARRPLRSPTTSGRGWGPIKGPKALIAQRLETRQHRYMPTSLLDSQFATLEEPRDALSVDIGPSPAAIAATIRTALQL